MSSGSPTRQEPSAAVTALLHLLPEAYLVLGPSSTIRYANPPAADLLAVPGDDLAGRRLAELVGDPDGLTTLLGRWSRASALRPGSVELASGTRLRCDGARLHGGDSILVRLRAHARSLDQFQRVNERVTTANLRELSRRLEASVAELREANVRLAAANEEIQQYARAVAHDIRTPLFTLQGFARLLAEDDHVDEVGAEYVEFILGSTARLEETTAAILEIARLERAVRSGGPTDTAEVLDQVVADLGDELTGADVRIHGSDLLPVGVDGASFRRVLQNLLANSIRHGQVIDRPLNITVTSRHLATDVAFTVRDDGAGVDEADRPGLFELFRRGAGTAEVPGTGIGLATCRKIVSAWGGTITCEPVTGPGACFVFTAPPATPGHRPAAVPARASGP